MTLSDMFENAAKLDLERNPYFDRVEDDLLFIDTNSHLFSLKNGMLPSRYPNILHTHALTKKLSFAHTGFRIFVQAKAEKQSWLQILVCSGDRVVTCSSEFVVNPPRSGFSSTLKFPEEADIHVLNVNHTFEEKNTPFQLRLGSTEPTLVEICELEIYKT